MTAHHLDRAIEALARRQHGTFSRKQARTLGASASFIDRRVARGAWLVLAPAVYSLPGNPATFRRQCLAAVLGEPSAWISGRTAAALHGLEGFRPGRIEITVPARARHVSALASVRRTDAFVSTVVDAIPVGTVAQTFCDLSPRVPRRTLEDALDLALSHGLVDVAEVCRRVEAMPVGARRRLGALVDVLGVRRNDAFVPPTTVLEAALYRALDDVRLPLASRQVAFPWRSTGAERLDALIEPWRVIVEADGRAWHTRVADFARDLQRDRTALRHGYETARYPYAELVHEPERVVLELLEIGANRIAA